MTDPIEVMRRTGSLNGVPSWGEGVKAGGSEGLPAALSIFNLVESARQSLAAGLMDIERDKRLTPVGKQEVKTELGERQSKKMAEIRAGIAQVRRGRDRKAANATVRDPFDGNETALAVWTNMVAGMLPADALLVKQAYQDASERNDLRTVTAIEHLPQLHPGRPDDATMAELTAARIRADDPPAARALAEQDRAIADLEALADELAGEVRKLTGEGGTVIRFTDGSLRDGDGRELDPDTYKPIESENTGGTAGGGAPGSSVAV